jgi:putative GTP pyrophosphokinase
MERSLVDGGAVHTQRGAQCRRRGPNRFAERLIARKGAAHHPRGHAHSHARSPEIGEHAARAFHGNGRPVNLAHFSRELQHGTRAVCPHPDVHSASRSEWSESQNHQLGIILAMEQMKYTYPGGSKGRVNRAGVAVRENSPAAEDLAVIDEWRAAHRGVLNTFQAILRNRTRGTSITVAQRHKRKRTIFDKLHRFPQMQLARMDDVAGCRLIFRHIKELYTFRATFHRARFNHKRRNDLDKYDYIKQPKETGYRGVHDIYEYDVNSDVGRALAGLYVEIQYRTLVQHAWATAVEVIGFVTESQPKFQQGDRRYEHAMALASEILARAHESSKGPFPDMPDRDLVRSFLALEDELHLLRMLRGLNATDRAVSAKRNAILIMSATGELEVKTFREAPDALRALFELERDMPDRDIVLVRADTSDEVRIAFRNYFSDARDFIRLVEDGCAKLTPPTRGKARERKKKTAPRKKR